MVDRIEAAPSGVEAAADLGIDQVLALTRQVGDVLVLVDHDRAVTWASSPAVVTGVPLQNLVDADAAERLDELLCDQPAGPVVARMVGNPASAVTLSAVPRPGGWVVHLRRPRSWPGRLATDGTRRDAGAAIADGDQVLDELTWLLSATPRTGKEIAVAAVVLDDPLGLESAGPVPESVSRVVGARVATAIRSGDLVGRLSADRYLVVLRGVHHLRGAIRVANKIRAAVEDPVIASPQGQPQTASVGVSLVSLGEPVDAILERVSSAVTLAQAVGGNVVRSEPPI